MDFRKQLLAFAWRYLKNPDYHTRQSAYIVVCRFMQQTEAYQTPEKIIYQVWVSLLKAYFPEAKKLVRKAVDVLMPVLVSHAPTISDENHVAVALCGPRNANLKLIERETGTQLHTRGNDLTIVGAAEHVGVARRLVEQLYGMARAGTPISPEDIGISRVKPEALKGGDAQANATALMAVLKGGKGPYRDIAILNAAASLIVAGKAKDLKEGAAIAAKSLDSGEAEGRLQRLIKTSNA